MVSCRVLVEGREIRFGALTFIGDDSAWLQEAPLDIDALPVRAHLQARVSIVSASKLLLHRPWWSVGLVTVVVLTLTVM